MSVAREKPAAAAVNGKLYVTGGWDSNGVPIATTEVYDPGSDSWSTVAPNPSPTAAPGVAVSNDKIYFIGGCADGNCTASNKVEVYDPSSNSWSSAANYPTGNSWEGCGGINGKVYCAGGINGGTTFNTGYVYDPSSDSWTPIANMPTDLWGGVAGSPTGELVISGGVINQSSTVTNEGFAYTPSSDSWSAIPNAQFPRYHAGGGCGFYKIGGSSGGFSPTADSEVLGPGLDQCGTTDVPWMSENPKEFDIAPGVTVTVTVTLAATTAGGVLQPGTYTGQILVNANAPQIINAIGVTMNVTPPKTWGKLQGTVTGTDCNNVTKGLSAVVFADGTGSGFSWTARTDKNGKYAFWGPKDTYTLIATANGGSPRASRRRSSKARPQLSTSTCGPRAARAQRRAAGPVRSRRSPAILKRMKVLLATLIVVLLATAAGAAGATSRSGLRGTVLISPSSPVCQPGTPCTKPAPHVLLRFWRNGRLVAHTRSDARGRYRIALRPRAYAVTTDTRGLLKPARVTVATDSYRRVMFRVDTGIR